MVADGIVAIKCQAICKHQDDFKRLSGENRESYEKHNSQATGKSAFFFWRPATHLTPGHLQPT